MSLDTLLSQLQPRRCRTTMPDCIRHLKNDIIVAALPLLAEEVGGTSASWVAAHDLLQLFGEPRTGTTHILDLCLRRH